MTLNSWTPQDDPGTLTEHRERIVFASPMSARAWYLDSPPTPPQSWGCRCYAEPIPLDRTPTRYPKRWSRAKRKAARAREARAVDRTIARVLGIARKFRRAP